MTRTAVLICPGRGTYNKAELGYLARHHAGMQTLLQEFDAIRKEEGQAPVTILDGADAFRAAFHTRGDIASPLIYASALADARSLADDVEVVAVTGNSMGWYIALAAGGCVSAADGFRIVNTMGRLMHEQGTGGQVVYPHVGSDWRPDPARKAELLGIVQAIATRDGRFLAPSIDLGGMLVIAGDAAGLSDFEATVPRIDDRFPMRLPNHAAFHTALLSHVSQAGQRALPPSMVAQPNRPLIDGRGHVWWPEACDTQALWDYTLGEQVVATYDFSAAIRTAAREFAPDLFIVTGPGTTLGGVVAQSLIRCGWKGMTDKATFESLQAETGFLVSMGRPEQRALVA